MKMNYHNARLFCFLKENKQLPRKTFFNICKKYAKKMQHPYYYYLSAKKGLNAF